MKIVVSGIQATNSLTLGNYLGALKKFISLQDTHKMYIFIADLHSITVDFVPEQLQDNRKSIAAIYKACGLDFEKNIVFYQSSVIEHSHLSYLLLCHSYMGELSRMTQFKDKSAKSMMQNKTQMIPTGLFVYPTLMAADILMYDADIIPVGADQKQHIELTRDLAIRFNKKYNMDIFKIPELYVSQDANKIMDLQNPTIKMSKSSENKKGTIFLLDPIDVIKSKIISAKTDSLNRVAFDTIQQPGISNLLNIYSSMTNIPIDKIVEKYKDKNYAEFKKDLADIVCDKILLIQSNYNNVIKDKNFEQIIIDNGKKCKKIAIDKINKIHKAMGLYYGN
ncbi:MAG: tryptophan--tRNA ligase [Malacoplasma sp.]